MKRWVAGLAVLALLPVVGPAAVSAEPQRQAPAVAKPGDRPYMGWSSWSLQATNYPGVNPNGPASWLGEANVVKQADVMAAKLKKHGYTYVNVDAGWHKDFDQYARPVVDPAKFPHGMKWLGDYVHRKGLKLGSYLAVGLYEGAYNNGNSPIFGTDDCHTRDIVYPDLRRTNGWDQAYKIDFANPCSQAYLDSIADLLASWGVDLLKLDGVGPGSFKGGANYDNTEDVKAYRKAIDQTGRPMEFFISWALSPTAVDTWAANTNGWRIDTDVECYCDTLVTWNNSVKQRWNDVVQWIPHAGPGHWNNLDSINVGNFEMDGVNEAERLSYMTFWAIESSPLYIGDDLTKLDDDGLALLTNDEVIAINQAGRPAKPLSQATRQQVWFSRQADGSVVVALFNLDDVPKRVTASWADLGITGKASVRDIWQDRDLGSTDGISTVVTTHGTRLLRVTPRDAGKLPATPTLLRGTGSTASSVSLTWDKSEYSRGIARYEVRAGNRTVSTEDTSVTVDGVTAGTAFSVVAVGTDGRKSAPSKAIELTPHAPVAYEAEAPENVVEGGASRGGCGGCSGGGKVGNLGGSGSLTYNNITAPADGTYLMAIDYVDASSSRTIVVTVNGVGFQLPMAGSADNNWDKAQRVVVPVTLKAGANTVKFGNPSDYAPDMDRIAV
jgi:alpha galactosidase A-like protein/alpha galactosidase C-like protein/fibronectin type III domain protein